MIALKTITLAEAIARGLSRYFTGRPCARGHVAERYVPNGGCVECAGRRQKWKPERKSRRPTDPRKWLLRNARKNNRRVGIPFDLSLDDLEWPKHCPVLGIELHYPGHFLNDPAAASLDRLRPDNGYLKGNVIIVSLRANALRADATTAELRAVVDFYTRLLG